MWAAVHRFGGFAAVVGLRWKFAVVEMELRFCERSKPVRPRSDIPSTEGDEYQFASLFHVGEIGQRRVLRVEQSRDAS